MMQLINLYFTAPRKDDNAYGALVNIYKTTLANNASDPRRAFSDSVTVMINNHHARTVLMNLKTLESMDQDKALTFFKERFAAPSDFTFIFTGNVNPEDESVKQAVLTYLGGLKSKKVSEQFTDNKIRKPRGLVNNHFAREMQIKKASNFILYSGALPYNIENRTAMTAIGNILNMRYLESIREKEGGSYGVGVRGSLSRVPVSEAVLMMQFDTDPEKQVRLMKVIHSEVDEIVANGPRPDDLQKVKENMIKKYSEDLRENSWWSGTLVNFYHDKINYVEDYTTAVEALTAEKIQSTLKKLTEQGNILEVVMKPAE
jgi:Predicted Zn-dependent peptidases